MERNSNRSDEQTPESGSQYSDELTDEGDVEEGRGSRRSRHAASPLPPRSSKKYLKKREESNIQVKQEDILRDVIGTLQFHFVVAYLVIYGVFFFAVALDYSLSSSGSDMDRLHTFASCNSWMQAEGLWLMAILLIVLKSVVCQNALGNVSNRLAKVDTFRYSVRTPSRDGRNESASSSRHHHPRSRSRTRTPVKSGSPRRPARQKSQSHRESRRHKKYGGDMGKFVEESKDRVRNKILRRQARSSREESTKHAWDGK